MFGVDEGSGQNFEATEPEIKLILHDFGVAISTSGPVSQTLLLVYIAVITMLVTQIFYTGNISFVSARSRMYLGLSELY